MIHDREMCATCQQWFPRHKLRIVTTKLKTWVTCRSCMTALSDDEVNSSE